MVQVNCPLREEWSSRNPKLLNNIALLIFYWFTVGTKMLTWMHIFLWTCVIPSCLLLLLNRIICKVFWKNNILMCFHVSIWQAESLIDNLSAVRILRKHLQTVELRCFGSIWKSGSLLSTINGLVLFAFIYHPSSHGWFHLLLVAQKSLSQMW